MTDLTSMILNQPLEGANHMWNGVGWGEIENKEQ